MTARQALHIKLAGIAAGIVVLILVPFAIWRGTIDAYLASEAFAEWVRAARPYAWAVLISLLVADVFLPVPATALMAMAGAFYGALPGGLIGTAGSMLAGLTAYGLARLAGRRAARLLAGPDELADLQRFFDTWGVGGIILSRGLPVMPEVLTSLAGLARMRWRRFAAALAVGALPVSFLLAWLGDAAAMSSWLLLVLTVIPAGAWVVYLLWFRRFRSGGRPGGQA